MGSDEKPWFSGDSSSVQARLLDITEVRATGSAFAAVTTTGQVVTWGNAAFGGDSGQLQDLEVVQSLGVGDHWLDSGLEATCGLLGPG